MREVPRRVLPAAVAVALLGGLVAGLVGREAVPRQDGTGLGPPASAQTAARQSPAHRDAPVGAREGGQPPDVVVVMADDMRADDVRFMPRTRRLLGESGVTFANSFSPAPLCCPARASFLTGQYAHNHGVVSHEQPWGFQAFDDGFTLASALRRSGYRTGFVGKYLNGYGKQRSRATGGPSLTYVPPGWTEWHAALEPPADSRWKGNTYNYRHVTYNRNGRIDDSRRGEYSTAGFGSISRELVRSFARHDAPFFLYASYVAPHFGGPRETDDPLHYVPARYRDDVTTPARPEWVRGRFDDVVRRGSGMPADGGPSEADMSDKPPFMRQREDPPAVLRRAIRDVTRQRAESLFVLDREVGRLVRTLRESGRWRNTVLLFTSDNGFFLGEHRRGAGKILAHEPSLRVPLLVTGPGMRSGERRRDPASTVDVTATILDLAGATAAMERRLPQDGRSLVPIARSGDEGWSAPVVSEGHLWPAREGAGRRGFRHGLSYIGIRTPQYSYVRYDRDRAEELYDLEHDANQLVSRHDDPAYRAVRRTLRMVWEDYADCAAEGCRAAMPRQLQADPARLQALDRAFWRQVGDRHGH